MENLDQHYFYNEEIIKNYLIKQDKLNLWRDIININWLQKSEIWKDICDVNDKRIELLASDSQKKKDKFNEAYDAIVGQTNKKFIKGYKNLIWTLLALLKTPEYIEYKEKKRDEIRFELDYKYALESQFWKDFIYKIDYLFKKHIVDIWHKLLTIEYIIDQINKWKIKDIDIKIDEINAERLKRLTMTRYDIDWNLIE